MSAIVLPVVSWAGPLQAAQMALREAEDLFEKKRFAEGIQSLEVVQDGITKAVEFIVANHAEK